MLASCIRAFSALGSCDFPKFVKAYRFHLVLISHWIKKCASSRNSRSPRDIGVSAEMTIGRPLRIEPPSGIAVPINFKFSKTILFFRLYSINKNFDDIPLGISVYAIVE